MTLMFLSKSSDANFVSSINYRQRTVEISSGVLLVITSTNEELAKALLIEDCTLCKYNLFKLYFNDLVISCSINQNQLSAKMLIGGSVSLVAGKQAIRTVYWRTGSNGRLLKTAKTCMFQGPPKPAPSSTSAASIPLSSGMDKIPKTILNTKN